MKTKVLALDKVIFDAETKKIVVPGIDGELCLLEHHMPFITIMKKGILKIFKKDSHSPTIIHINHGICSFEDNAAILLVSKTEITTE